MPTAVVAMAIQLLLPEAVGFKEMMKQRDDAVSSLSWIARFVDQIVHLFIDDLAVNTKQATLPWGLKLDGAWLLRVCRVVDLLCKIKRVMHSPII